MSPVPAVSPSRDPSPRRVVLMTAGGTREPIDDVRHISNVASGQLPAAMAECWLRLGATVHYIHGPDAHVPGVLRVSVPLRDGALETTLDALRADALARRAHLGAGELVCYPIRTAADAARVVREVAAAQQPTLAACAMAVADFAPVPVIGKLSSRPNGPTGDVADAGETLHIALRPTPKVIDLVLQASPGTALLGFKLLSGADEAAHQAAARHLARRSGARWVFGNDMSDYRRGVRRGVLRGPEGQVLAVLGDAQGLTVRALAEALVSAVEARLRV